MDGLSTEHAVLEILQRAASQDPNILKTAEEKLKEWEIQPGFYSVLVKIISNHSIHFTIRWLAVLCLKNGVEKYWRKTAPNAIREDEKVSLKLQLLETFGEPVNQVATQLAVVISKAARLDCPRDWPELIPNLLQAVQASDCVTQHRALLTLRHVVKQLASRRLAGDRYVFYELTCYIYSFIHNLWNSSYNMILAQVQSDCQPMDELMEKTLLSVRILYQLTVYGYKTPHESHEAVTFVSSLFDRIKTLLQCRRRLEERTPGSPEVSKKIIVNLVKVVYGLLEYHPFSFVGFIQPSLVTAVTLLVDQEWEPFVFERVVIQCLNLVKMIVICQEYNSPAACNNPSARDAKRLRAEFFTPDVVTKLCTKLVTHYFLLTREDLELWDSDPEEFLMEDVGESWKYNLRPCTESLFVSMFGEYRAIICSILLELIKNNHPIVSPDDLQGILLKDAVYNAVGMVSFHLFDEVDFDQWLTSTLLTELQVPDSNYRVLRRRVTCLIGKWIDVKLSKENRPLLYRALIPLMKAEEDMVVRLSAAATLKSAVDDFDFTAEQFLEFLPSMFHLLFTLLQDAKECDTKIRVLYVISFVVERVGFAIKPYSADLIAYLPGLWKESENHHMLRGAIVMTFVQFVKALVSENLTGFLYSVIELSVDLTGTAHVYLLEEGLDLWLAVVENTTEPNQQLLTLFQKILPLLESHPDCLVSCCLIVQAYVLLVPEEVMLMYGDPLCTTLALLLTDMDKEQVLTILDTVLLAIKANHQLTINMAAPIFNFAVLRLLAAEDTTLVVTSLLSLLSRLVLHNGHVFCQVVDLAAQSVEVQPDALFQRILNIWIETVPLMATKENRKLSCLALSALLSEPRYQAVLAASLEGLLRNIIETIHDVSDFDPASKQQLWDTLVYEEHDDEGTEGEVVAEAEHERRKRQLAEQDLVYNWRLKDFADSHLERLRQQLGPVTGLSATPVGNVYTAYQWMCELDDSKKWSLVGELSEKQALLQAIEESSESRRRRTCSNTNNASTIADPDLGEEPILRVRSRWSRQKFWGEK